jgi:N-acetylglutamate synthase-like GNAT family acetyltransferase
MEDVVIRSASKKDIPVILDLLYELGRPKPKKDSQLDTFEKLITKYSSESDKEILVAENQASVVGMVSITYLSRLNQEFFEMYIPELIVTQNYKNQGIGKKLIESCVKLAKDKKCHRIRLESGNQRKESHIFYKSLGFEQSGLSFTKNLK